jgi:hypothetical protein
MSCFGLASLKSPGGGSIALRPPIEVASHSLNSVCLRTRVSAGLVIAAVENVGVPASAATVFHLFWNTGVFSLRWV